MYLFQQLLHLFVCDLELVCSLVDLDVDFLQQGALHGNFLQRATTQHDPNMTPNKPMDRKIDLPTTSFPDQIVSTIFIPCEYLLRFDARPGRPAELGRAWHPVGRGCTT
jgi:hypothetical protein